MARGLSAIVEPGNLTIIVNIGDDDEIYGVHVSADLDTVLYTLAGIEGPDGWGVHGDTFAMLAALEIFGIDTTFRLGDRDLATCLARTLQLRDGISLSAITAGLAQALRVAPTLLPASDDPVRTLVLTEKVGWINFQEYFVLRRHTDKIKDLKFAGAAEAAPAPGVISAIRDAARVIIAPSNPPLSIWPILAVPSIRSAISDHPRVIAISPLIGGSALRGPANQVMSALGLPPGNRGVIAAYDGLIDILVIDTTDRHEATHLQTDVDVMVANIRIGTAEAGAHLAEELLTL